jgi:hypothetical protein
MTTLRATLTSNRGRKITVEAEVESPIPPFYIMREGRCFTLAAEQGPSWPPEPNGLPMSVNYQETPETRTLDITGLPILHPAHLAAEQRNESAA